LVFALSSKQKISPTYTDFDKNLRRIWPTRCPAIVEQGAAARGVLDQLPSGVFVANVFTLSPL
jgi:hypothetical protein